MTDYKTLRSNPTTMGALSGKVAVVAGATRGAGLGIAVALGEAGATVYCMGRSTRGHAPAGRPETIEGTAARVTDAGGRKIAARVDHLQEAEVRALFGRVRAERKNTASLTSMGDGPHWGRHATNTFAAGVKPLDEAFYAYGGS